MPPLDPSIPLQTKTLDPQTMGQWIGLARQKQQLERERETFEADVEQRKAESKRAIWEAYVSHYTAQPRVRTAEGTASSAESKAQVDRANVQPLIEQQQAHTQRAKTDASAAQFDLAGAHMQRFLDYSGQFVDDPDFDPRSFNKLRAIGKVRLARDKMVRAGVPEELAESMSARLINQINDDPGGVKQSLANGIQAGLGAQGQASQNLVPATQRNAVIGNDVRGNPLLVTRDRFGGASQSGVPVAPAGQPGRPNPGAMNQPPPPLIIPPGESPDTRAALSKEREDARRMALEAPNMRGLTDEILTELPKATVGQYSGVIQKGLSLAGMMGVTLTGKNEAERAASAYDLIDKYTTQLALAAAQKMGGGTATEILANQQANASTSRNPTALAKTLKRNMAVIDGGVAYQQGLERAIAAYPQQDVFVKRQFDQAWAGAFDPVIVQLYNAQRTGDRQGLADLQAQISKRDREQPGYAVELKRKATVLQALSQGRF